MCVDKRKRFLCPFFHLKIVNLRDKAALSIGMCLDVGKRFLCPFFPAEICKFEG